MGLEGEVATYEIREPLDIGQFTARMDLTDAPVLLAAEQTDEVSTVGVFTTSGTGTPYLRNVLLREAFGCSR